MSLSKHVWSREGLLADLEDNLRVACEGDLKWNRFAEEYRHQKEEYNRSEEELNKLKELKFHEESDQVLLLELRKEVADSKSDVAYHQQLLRQNELEMFQLQKDLSVTVNPLGREWIKQRLEQVAGICQSYENELLSIEKKANDYEGILEQLELTVKEEEKRQEKQSKKLLDDALKEGFVEVVIVVCIILGQPGVGKTHVKYLLLDKRPPQLRSSTICAETPVRIEIRTVSGSRVQNIRGQWKEVSDEEMLDIVARMILEARPQLSQRSEQGIWSKVAKLLQLDSRGTAGAKLPTFDSSTKQKRKAKHPKSTIPTLSDACQKAVDDVMDKLLERITKLRSGSDQGESTAESSGGYSAHNLSEIVINSKWVYFTDSGGQPQYHELLPLFVRCISSALCVTRLTDKLDETQEVEYYQEGSHVGATQQSQLSTKDTIQCLVNTIQSYSAQDEPPKIIMVGTHLDKLEEVSDMTVETLEEKDEKLLEMLKPEFSDQLVYSARDMKKLIFPVNALNPGFKEKKTAQDIRCRVEESGARKVKIPIWWYILELLLQKLAKELGRGVLSRAECLKMARKLYIQKSSFDAALRFFDELNVIKYSPDVLPDVVFIDSQIPLDKVSELVHHNFLLRKPALDEGIVAVDGEWQHFRDQGVVSKECLKKFKRHYFSHIFSVDDLCKLLKKLLVFAPIPRPDWAPKIDCPSDEETHFVMPALLIILNEAELEKYRICSPGLATLLVRFPRRSRRAGVFCCFVVHLIKHCHWNLLLNLAAEEPLYRNCIKMHLPIDPPCSVTLIDSNSLIEVYVRIADDVHPSKCMKHLNVIKNAILSGITSACIALNYKETNPDLTFYCPHSQPCSPTAPAMLSKELKPHTASLNDNNTYLICDIERENSYQLELKHKLWFGSAEVSSELSPSAACTRVELSQSNQLSPKLPPPPIMTGYQSSAELSSLAMMNDTAQFQASVSSSEISVPTTTTSKESHSFQSSPKLCLIKSSDAAELQANIDLSTSLSSTEATLAKFQQYISESSSKLSSPMGRTSLSDNEDLHDLRYTLPSGPLSQSTPIKSTQDQSSSGSGAPHLPHIPQYISISSEMTQELNDMSKPTSSNLTVIRWKNEKGEIKKFRLKQSIIHKWKSIGDLVVPRQQLEVWAKKKEDEESCRAVISYWLDHPPRHYPATWEGLYELLDDCELSQVIIELKQAVDNAI